LLNHEVESVNKINEGDFFINSFMLGEGD